MALSVQLRYPRKDGACLQDHYEQSWKSGMPIEYDIPLPPPGLEWLWSSFWELSAGRGSNGFGANPLSYLEIDAWSKLTGTHLTPLDVRMLKSMDAAFLEATRKAEEE